MPPELQLPPGAEKRAHVSASRFQPFLQTTGDIAAAWALYDWNIEASAAMYEVLHRVEIVLRNAIDLQLRFWNRDQPISGSSDTHAAEWIEDPCLLLDRLADVGINDALDWADKHRTRGRSISHDDLVARMPLGTWRYLIWGADAGRQRLWNEALRHGFPYYPFRPADFERDVDDLHKLRNRIAHLEPIVNVPLTLRLESAQRVLNGAHPSLGSWCTDTERVSAVLSRKPA